MSWYVRISRFLSAHMVYAQHAQNSCGIASITMVNFKQKKGVMLAGLSAAGAVSSVPIIGSALASPIATAAINYAVTTEKAVYAEYTKVTGSPYDGSEYSDADNFPAVLKNLGLGEWEVYDMPANSFAATAKAATDRGSPIIARVEWSGNLGAHFVVIDEFHAGYACVCDPWDGELHVVSMPTNQRVNYNASDRIFSFSLGGTRHNYPASSTGVFSEWIVRKKI